MMCFRTLTGVGSSNYLDTRVEGFCIALIKGNIQNCWICLRIYSTAWFCVMHGTRCDECAMYGGDKRRSNVVRPTYQASRVQPGAVVVTSMRGHVYVQIVHYLHCLSLDLLDSFCKREPIPNGSNKSPHVDQRRNAMHLSKSSV